MSASGDGGDDRELVTIANRRVESAAEADVFVVQVIGHERIWLPAVVDESGREGREAAADVGDGFADRVA